MKDESTNELKTTIEKFDMAHLLVDYQFNHKTMVNAVTRVKTPTVTDRVNACRYSVENFEGMEVIDVIISMVAASTVRFGQAHKDDDGTITVQNQIALPPDYIIDNFDYADLVRINMLMGKGIKHALPPAKIKALLAQDIVPLHTPYTINGVTFNAAVRHRRPVVRDHIEARSYSVEHWGHHFGDIVTAATAARSLRFGTLSQEDDKPVITNQVEVSLEFIVEKFLYPDLVLLNNLLVKSPASSVSGAQR